MLHHQPQPVAPALFCVYAHLLIGIQPPSIWTETSLIHTCDQSGFDIGLIIYVCLHLPAINNVRLTLFSCIREDHSTVHEVLFTISTVIEQPEAEFSVELCNRLYLIGFIFIVGFNES